jgi:sulfide:quinone oxidoreductase
MHEPTVLILGCGMGGVVAAREARRLLPASYRIVVIDKEAEASFPPAYLKLMSGEVRPEVIKRRRAQLGRRGIEFVNAEVRQIDVANRYVRADSREFHYDYLVIALGAETSLDTKPGLTEAAHSFYMHDGAERLAASLRYFSGGRVVIAISGLPFKSPTAPYEAAMLLEHSFHERRIRQNVEIAIYTPETTPLAVMGTENSEAVMGLLAHKGIEFHPDMRIAAVDTSKHEIGFDDGATSAFQLLIVVPEHRAPAVVREAGLVDESGWISVNPATLETQFENVFALGDVAYIAMADGQALPKTGAFAEGQAEVAARNIGYRVKGGRLPAPFDATGRFFLEVGAGAAAAFEGDFLARRRVIQMKQPSIIWHWAKLALDRYQLLRGY